MKTTIFEIKLMALICGVLLAGVIFGDGPVWILLKAFEIACGRM